METETPQRPSSAHRFAPPRRSRGDRKVAGVAGGLGRAFGVDPVLIRVAFVVLAIFGGSGVLLYCLGWLLMPADGDEVSAIEALAGRGQSSVSTGLTVVLIIVGLSSIGSVFSWGLPFWPVVIAAIVVFVLARHGRMGSGSRLGHRPRSVDWGRRADEFAERAAAWGARVGERADEWTQRWSSGDGPRRGGARGGAGSRPSPFGRPAFWDAPTAAPGTDAPTSAGWDAPDPATRQSGGPAASGGAAPTGSPVTDSTSPGPAPTQTAQSPSPSSSRPPSPEDLLTGGRATPPAWDPLGVAPFAWDLPDPTESQPPATATPARGRGLSRTFLGLALVTGGVLAGGVFAGWWALSWAAVAGITLAVLGLGVLITSLRGAGGRGLIGPGVFLSLVTLALTATGISGTGGYGQQTWTVPAGGTVDSSYVWNAGQATLDLSALQFTDDKQVVTTSLTVHGGRAVIIVPKGVEVEATCSAGLGDVRCLDNRDNGVKPETTGHQQGKHGKLVIDVHANAGQAEVRSNG